MAYAKVGQLVSKPRAAAAVAALAAHGIEPSRLDSVGFGMDKPVAANDGDGGRAQNRRMEIVKT